MTRFIILHSPHDTVAALYLGDILDRHPQVAVASLDAAADLSALSQAWPEAAARHHRLLANSSSMHGDAPLAVGLVLSSDALERHPQLLRPLQQALGPSGAILRLTWRSAVGRAAHRLRAAAGMRPVPLGGAPLAPSVAQLREALRREAAAEWADRQLVERLLSRAPNRRLQRGGAGAGAAGRALAAVRVPVEQLSVALNATVSAALRAVALPAAHGRWWSLESAWLLDSWQRVAARATGSHERRLSSGGSGGSSKGSGGKSSKSSSRGGGGGSGGGGGGSSSSVGGAGAGAGSGGGDPLESAASEMGMADYYTMLRALEAEDAAMEVGRPVRRVLGGGGWHRARARLTARGRAARLSTPPVDPHPTPLAPCALGLTA